MTTRTLRLLHRYLGLFFAPAILFFAFTGALQTFSFHEGTKGSAYTPPRWMVYAGQLHKKQNMNVKPKPAGPAPAVDPMLAKMPAPVTGIGISTTSLLLKYFVFAMSLGLLFTTLLGIVMALRYGGKPRTVWIVLALGTVFPVAFVLMMRG